MKIFDTYDLGSHLTDIFDKAATSGTIKKSEDEIQFAPTLQDLFGAIEWKFNGFDRHFEDAGSKFIITAWDKNTRAYNGDAISISQNDDKTFSVNLNGAKTSNKNTIDEATVALGRYFKSHSKFGPPSQPQPEPL